MSNAQCTSLVLALDDGSATLEQVGGKGASLARLAASGLPVPPGFHITTGAYRRFVEENGLQEQILAAVSGVSVDQPATLDEASRQISELFARGVISTELTEAIHLAYAALGNNLPVAVRSSATAEDLPEMSFAGQQETYLNMRGETMVLDAVKRCWASLWTARAIGYRARHHISPSEVSLAVVVQELVPADAAGILFTANPLTGAREQVMINAAWGLGEAIVGGLVTPDTFVVDKASKAIVTQEISDKEVMTTRTLEGTHEEPVPEDQRTKAALSSAQAAELARIGVQIEDLYGQPMDIEWAGRRGHIFVVQARPITALPDPPQVKEPLEWKLPRAKGHYMRSSVIELLPDPLSPLFMQLGLPAWNRSMAQLAQSIGLDKLLGNMLLTTVNGYAYYELDFTPMESLQIALMMPGIFLRDMPRLMRSARQRWEKKAHPTYKAVVERWEAIDLSTTSSTDLLAGVQEIITVAADYYLTIQSGILPAAYISEAFFTILYDKFLKRRADPPVLTLLLGYDSAPIQAEEALYDLARWARAHDELSNALSAISNAQFTTAYQAGHLDGLDRALWSEFCQRFAAYLARFGHTIFDLDFSKSVPADDPAALLETLKFFLSGNAPDPYARQATSAQAREQAVQSLQRRLRGPFRSFFLRQMQRAQRFVLLRENGLADVGLGWPILRRMLRSIGQRLVTHLAIVEPDDVFWLTFDELREAAVALDTQQSPANHHAVVAERRLTWQREHAVTPLVALPPKVGARFLGIDFSRFMPARDDQPEGNVLKGIAASPGRITGPARIIHGPAEFGQMQQGDILVARITTPAWTPLFALASGIVTDVGGPLSHSSIVAREYHIPAVLGTGVATERLNNGESIVVDGNAGTVTLAR